MIGSLLKPGIVSLMKNVNGNHVAQHCLQFMVPDYIEVRGIFPPSVFQIIYTCLVFYMLFRYV